MRKGLAAAALLAAGLAGCGATPVEHRNYREIGPGEGLFSGQDGFVWRRYRKEDEPVSPTVAAQQEEFKKWRESAGAPERQEFEDWRAWQEWKRKNPK